MLYDVGEVCKAAEKGLEAILNSLSEESRNVKMVKLVLSQINEMVSEQPLKTKE